jgi:hypothetical protein
MPPLIARCCLDPLQVGCDYFDACLVENTGVSPPATGSDAASPDDVLNTVRWHTKSPRDSTDGRN